MAKINGVTLNAESVLLRSDFSELIDVQNGPIETDPRENK
jgi:hypothetical protein